VFMLYSLLIGFALGSLLGGRPSGLARLHFRWTPLAAAGLAVQIVLFSPAVTEVVGAAGPPLYVASTLAVVAVVVRNVSVAPGLALVAVGAIANLVAIVSNGGYMPVTPDALAASGRVVSGVYSNSLETARPAFELLVDRFAMPRQLPLANVFSIGDVIVGLGLVIVIVSAMRAVNRIVVPGNARQGEAGLAG
jgi:hypothetical protein